MNTGVQMVFDLRVFDLRVSDLRVSALRVSDPFGGGMGTAPPNSVMQ